MRGHRQPVQELPVPRDRLARVVIELIPRKPELRQRGIAGLGAVFLGVKAAVQHATGQRVDVMATGDFRQMAGLVGIKQVAHDCIPNVKISLREQEFFEIARPRS